MENNTFLLQQLAKGNKAVFKQLFDEYYYPLYGFTKKFVDDKDVCKDIVQDAFVGFWERREELLSSEAIKSYLYSTVRNLSLNYLRREDMKKRNESNILALSSDWYFQDSLLKEEVHSQIYEEIEKLSPRSREIILLAMNGVSNEDIASQLDISVNTVKTHKLRGYNVLRERLKGIHWLLLLLLT